MHVVSTFPEENGWRKVQTGNRDNRLGGSSTFEILRASRFSKQGDQAAEQLYTPPLEASILELLV